MAGLPIWYELMVPDPAAVTPFYRDILGWQIEPVGGTMPNGSQYRMIGRADGGHAGGVLTLTANMLENGAAPGWFTYFHVSDVEETAALAQAKGAQLWMPPQKMEGVGTIAMLADPFGASFYVMDPVPPEGAPDQQSDVFDSERSGHCRWNELSTADEPAAREFYSALFDWQSDDAMEMPDGGTYRFIAMDGTAIGAISSMASPSRPGGWLPYFGVSDIEAAGAAVESGGGTLVTGPHEVPGGDHILIIRDPAGAILGLVGPKGAGS